MMKDGTAFRKLPGGREITERVMIKEDANFQWYTGTDTLSTIQSDNFREAKFQWKQAAGAAVVSGKDYRNAKSDKYAKQNLMNGIKSAAEITIKQGIGKSLWDVTPVASGGADRILAIPTIVDDTTVVGGLDPATYPLWASTVTTVNATVEASTGSEILDAMEETYNTIMATSGMAPDLVVANSAIYTKYGRACQELKRFDPAVKYRADLGFSGYAFNQAMFVLDGYAPANEIYFLNSEDFKLNVHEDAMFSFTPLTMRQDEDAYFTRILFQGELSVRNRKSHGKIVFNAAS